MTLAGGDSVALVFRSIELDSAAAFYFGKRGVRDLAMLTRTLRDSTVGTVREGIETFRWGGREVAAYEVRSNGGKLRVAVFGSKGNYYECEAAALRKLSAPSSYDRLWSAQEAVLRSLK